LRFKPAGECIYSSFIYRFKPDFGKFLKGDCNWFWNVFLWKDTQAWENDVLMITGLQAYKTTGDALTNATCIRTTPPAWPHVGKLTWPLPSPLTPRNLPQTALKTPLPSLPNTYPCSSSRPQTPLQTPLHTTLRTTQLRRRPHL
jgi:hypothetical protein